MEDVANFIASLFKDMKLSTRWVAIVLIIFLTALGLLGFEYLTGHFYYQSLERKINLLKELQLIANEDISKNPELYPIYQSAVKELSRCEVRNLAFLPPRDLGNPVIWGKAIGGALVWLLILAVGVVSEVKKTGKLTGIIIAVAVVLIIIAAIFAWIGTIIPTIYAPWVNYVGFPLIQLVFLFLLTRKQRNPANRGT